jgi:hypothetical protein
VLDAGALAGCTVVDALGFVENDTANSNVVYSDDLGFTTVGPGLDAGGLPTFNADWLYRFTTASGAAGGWAGTDVLAVGATTASGLIVDNLRQIGFATSTRPAVQTLGAGSTTVRAIDPGVPNLIIADASWTIPQGAGSVGLSISVPSIPGATAFTAVSIDPANGSSTTAYFGNLFGLWIPEADFVFQLTAGVAPFTMALDGSGSASFGLRRRFVARRHSVGRHGDPECGRDAGGRAVARVRDHALNQVAVSPRARRRGTSRGGGHAPSSRVVRCPASTEACSRGCP